MKSLKLLSLFFILAVSTNAFAQSFKQLKIGDTVPDISLNNVMNYKTKTAKLYDFKDKIIILDFWATWCGPCIKSLPALNELQKKYTNDIVILPVTYETKEKVISCFSSLPSLKNINLPIVFLDTILNKIFPKKTIPHEVIIKNGVVVAVTGADMINSGNLEKIIKGIDIKIYEKKAGYQISLEELRRKPLFLDSLAKNNLIQQKLFGKYLEGETSFTMKLNSSNPGSAPNIKNTNRLVGINNNVKSIMKLACSKIQGVANIFPDNRMKVNVKNKTPFIQDSLKGNELNEWRKNNLYCFDYLVPQNSKQDVFDILRCDLETFFNVIISYKAELVDCYILKAIDGTEPESRYVKQMIDKGKEQITFQKHAIRFILEISNISSPIPIVDETNYNGTIDLILRNDFTNFEFLKSDFRKSGLELSKAKRKLMIMTVTDK